MAGCPSSHQPTRIREETLESGGPLNIIVVVVVTEVNAHVLPRLIKGMDGCFPTA